MSGKELNLEVLLPHRDPMILLDEALDYGDDYAKARLSIHPGSRFFDESLNGVPAWVGVEYMAQTMGIWSGSQQILRSCDVQIGFLLGSRSYKSSHSTFVSGVQLLIDIKVLFCGEDGVGAFECTINGVNADGENVVTASARINAFLPDDSSEFMRKQL